MVKRPEIADIENISMPHRKFNERYSEIERIDINNNDIFDIITGNNDKRQNMILKFHGEI
jgi:cytidylate kinase